MKKNFSIYCQFLSLFFILTNMVYAAPVKVQGVVKDSLSKEVLSYANLGLKKYPIGTCTNLNGEFQLIVNDTLANEMITVSMMGYESKSYKISDMKNIYFEILLNPHDFQLGEIKVTPDQLTGEEVLKNVIKNHNRNFPFGFSFYETFFRDLVRNDSPEAMGKIYRMTEAAINIEDFGLDSYRDPKFKIHEIRNSFNYVESSKQKYFVFTGIQNPVSWIYRTTNFVSRSNLKKLLKDNCYSKEIIGLTEFDGTLVYILELREKYLKFLGMKILELTNGGYNSDILYVNSRNWAIQEAKHTFIAHDSLSYLLKVELKMQEFDGKYYLKLLEYNGIIPDEYSKIDKDHFYMHKASILVNDIVLERKSIERIRLRNAMKTDLPLWNIEYKYNPEFWENYTILLDKPLDTSVIKDLERDESLKNQFKDGGLKNSKK